MIVSEYLYICLCVYVPAYMCVCLCMYAFMCALVCKYLPSSQPRARCETRSVFKLTLTALNSDLTS